MKVLWLSNRIIDNTKDNRTGTWLTSLGPELVKDGSIELANISTGEVRNIVRYDYGKIIQWIVPNDKIRKDGLPSKATIKKIQIAVKEFGPDIIQIWGTEKYWGLLTARGLLPGKHLLTMQGVISSMAPVFYGGLTNLELMKCFGIKEVLFPSASLIASKRQCSKKLPFEAEIIRKHKYIITQSEWVKAFVSLISPNHVLFNAEHHLRKEFINCTAWNEVNTSKLSAPILFTSNTGEAYKGLHVLIRSLAILKQKYPDIILNIAGIVEPLGIRKPGYYRWLRKLISLNDLSKNIHWLGQLGAEELINQLQVASVYINPSFVESYSVALAEAMAVGTPSVVSFAGAMPELAQNEISALFFTPGDQYGCVRQIERLLNDFDLARRISQQARIVALDRNNPVKIIKNQLDIYKSIN